MPASPVIIDLVERFERNYAAYKSGTYNETQVRREFIDPFFEALGWDVNNTQGYAEAYKDVIHEDAVKVGGVTKAPDYSFRIGGTRKFFVEAKKPSILIKDDPGPAFQVRRYAWSAKLPLSIVTDFEELAVYDCRIKPDQKDRADKARVAYYTFRQYMEKWDEISAIFSRDAILKGSFDKYAESHKTKRGTSEVDSAFLEEIESWRDTLARNIALRNSLGVRELNEAVQRTIDRIIFLRIAEDRGIEEYGSLRGIGNGPNTFVRLRELFYKADDRYNSGLFHFRHEKGQAEPPDNLTISLTIDDKPLKDIFKRLYYPDSPYEFAVLPADILGQVYEQFLGKVIRLTSDHRAVVEDKPEVKKAGGVFYTPTYIVEYIVKNTVGKLLEGKTPKQSETIRILDPACGSGSFLLGAYQYLLDWHLAWYVGNDPEKWAKAKQPTIHKGKGDTWHLTTAERKKILLNNIYGVDIDSQAVEVTKLSLLLKVLEGETGETLNQQMRLFHERALPDLGDNIKCGNSLIGSNYLDRQQLLFMDAAERNRVNLFDWQAVFPQIFRNGGFDAVIGNPPYIRIQTMKEWAPREVDFYKEQYRTASKGNYDIYVLFVEKGLKLLNKIGRLGFILPHKFFNAQYGEPLRGLIAEGKHLSQIAHFGHQQVFLGATTYTCLLFLDAWNNPSFRFTKINDLGGWRQHLLPATVPAETFHGAVSTIMEPEIRYWTKVGISTTSTTVYDEGEISSDGISSAAWNFSLNPSADLFERLAGMPYKLGDVAHLFVGLQTDGDDVFILEELCKKDGLVLCKSKATGAEHWFEDEHLKPFLKGSLNIRRYTLTDVTKRLIFPYELNNGKSVLMSAASYKARFPLTWEYLELNRKRLMARNKGRMGDEWYGYVYKKNHTRFVAPKLLVPSIATGSCFAADLEGNYYFVGSGGGGGGGYGITLKDESRVTYLYLLGLLNSCLSSRYLQAISTPFRGGYIALNRQFIEQLPIRTIDFTSSTDKASHTRIVQLVEQMLSLHKQLPNARTGHDQTLIQRQIDATDRQIDKLVYELYGLTEEEIAVVEGKP
jgi:predicted type IV restriction endonuclease